MAASSREVDKLFLAPELASDGVKPECGVVVDYSNPLSQGIVRAVITSPATGLVYDAVSGRYYGGSASSLDFRDNERQLLFNGSTNYYEIPVSGVSDKLTVFSKIYLDSVLVGSHLRAAVVSDSSTTNVRVSIGRISSTYKTIRVNNNSGPTNHIVDSDSIDLVTNESHTCGTVEDGVNVTAAYFNGLLESGSTRASTTNSGVLALSGLDTLTLGAVTYSTGQSAFWNNHLSLAYVFNVAKTAHEMKAMHDDPYQIFMPAGSVSLPFVISGPVTTPIHLLYYKHIGGM